MRSLTERVLEEEILDQASDLDAARNLHDITRINWLTGARRHLMRQLTRRVPPAAPFRLLDAGAASGDFVRAVRTRFPHATTVCLDLQHRNLRAATGCRVQADAFRLPFPDRSFDIVHCSLLLHHFPSRQSAALIAELYRVSRGTVLIQDLHRHWLSYYFLPVTRWLFRWNEITVSDGMKSVAAAWRRHELLNLLSHIDLLHRSTVHWHFPSFRFFIAINSMD